MITISKDGSSDFKSIKDALTYVEKQYKEAGLYWEGCTLYIRNGFYKERVEIKVPYLTILGESNTDTIISGELYANMYSPDIGKLGTFRTYTMMVDTHDVCIKNLCIENTAGYGEKIGQAIALFSEGDHLVYENCRILGYQDTLYTGPLPPKEIEKNGFIGPKQFSPRINGRQHFRKCYIEGTIDFIFGSATAYFDDCILFQKNQNQTVNSYVTAASTAEGERYGYVFNHCQFLSDAPPETCFLGRPWRDYAQTVILNSFLGSQLKKEAWHNWGKIQAEKSVFYAEYNNYGPGWHPEERPTWIHILTEEEAKQFEPEIVLKER